MASLTISREQLAKFLPDNDTIKRFEKLFLQSGSTTPANIEAILKLIEELTVTAGTGDAKANQVADALATIARALEIGASQPGFSLPRSFPVDYLDFDQSPSIAAQTARVGWNSTDDTLDIQHSDGVTQQVGLETYARITNNTGSTIANGVAVGVDPSTNSYVLYIANGSLGSLNVVGVTTQAIANGAQGRVTVWGRVRDLDTSGTPFGEAWVAGDILYVSTTVAGGFTKVKPTAPNLSIPIAQVRVVSSTVGEIAVRPTIEQQLRYGQFVKTADQPLVTINTAEAITWNSSLIANGVTIGAPSSRIVVASAGLYRFTASFQLTTSSAGAKNVRLWFRKNGTDIANSTLIESLDIIASVRMPSRSLLISLAANDYVELMWACGDINVNLDALAATAFAPAAPAAILQVSQEQQ